MRMVIECMLVLVQVVATRNGDGKQRGREEEEEEERRAAKSKLECTLAARVVVMTRTKGAHRRQRGMLIAVEWLVGGDGGDVVAAHGGRAAAQGDLSGMVGRIVLLEHGELR
jgi:hypothetical protein